MNTSANTRAVAALLRIMDSKTTLLRRRIEAAEAILNYEASEEVIARAKHFLVAIFEDAEHVGVDDRLEALKLMRKAEAKKVVQQSTRSANSNATRELFRDMEISARRMKLDKAGLWGKHGPDWCDDLLSPNYEPPPPDTAIEDLFKD